ncbi:hypothetical protein E2C01_081365 [Portunus trituberculatus]|uniref:Uncharacterized protein n=1 Tax=Portunus trituberculatus TaxID=210409 RepID=A0A5B7J244_PORTR|nr:hypothetical protein [Portunus trituberculatus]
MSEEVRRNMGVRYEGKGEEVNGTEKVKDKLIFVEEEEEEEEDDDDNDKDSNDEHSNNEYEHREGDTNEDKWVNKNG